MKNIYVAEPDQTALKLRDALLRGSVADTVDAAQEIFGGKFNKTTAGLLRAGVAVYTQIEGVIGAQTVSKVLKGTHSRHKTHAAFGKYRGALYTEADLFRMGEVIDFALCALRKPVGDSFGPDHTFTFTEMDASVRDGIYSVLDSVYDATPGTEPNYATEAPMFTKKDASKLTKPLALIVAEKLDPLFPQKNGTNLLFCTFVSCREEDAAFLVKYDLIYRKESNSHEAYPCTKLAAIFKVVPTGPKAADITVADVASEYRTMWNVAPQRTLEPDLLKPANEAVFEARNCVLHGRGGAIGKSATHLAKTP